MDLIYGLLLVAVASVIIARACDGFEAAADYLGRNMTEGMKGATINAIGSSMPELFVTFIYLFLYHDTTGFSGGIGTTAGSAVFNAMVIPAVVIFAVLWKNANTKITVSRTVVIRDGITLLCAEAFLIFFLGETLQWYHGMFLMLLYVSYASWMIYRNRTAGEEDVEDDEDNERPGNRLVSAVTLNLEHAVLGNKSITRSSALLLLAVATFFIAAACWILVDSCEAIGLSLSLPGYFVAVILAAAASSVPDTILSVKDAHKGNYDDALANALGSNIFDICFALGLPLFLYTMLNGPLTIPAEAVQNIVELRILLFCLTFATFLLLVFSRRMTKATATVLMVMYMAFVCYVAGRAYDWSWATYIADYIHLLEGYLVK